MKGFKFSVVIIIIVAFILGITTHPFSKPANHKIFLNKIHSAEAYYNEAKALSLSMPLLPDSLVGVIADSLLVTLVKLNESWVIFVISEDGFEKYTEDIEHINESLDYLRVKYVLENAMRNILKGIRDMKEEIKKWDDEAKKYST